MSVERDLVARAKVHAALGDTTRLAIVDRLGVGDLSPGELAGALELTTNLLAHHLNVLEQAGAVERVRSEGDRRRVYVRLCQAAVGGLILEAKRGAPRVVFVCTHNSARSQLAAAAWARASQVPATSAGTRPTERVHPQALKVARRHRLPLPNPRTASVEAVVRGGDLVVAVCDNAHEELGARASGRLHWSIPDPVPIGTDDAFEHALDLIEGKIGRLAATTYSVAEKS